jgi:Kef-type K+ transport system membrane component KefB
LFAHFVSGVSGPAAIVIGNGLALSSTAVVLQVLQERGESTSRHGRATFSVLLFQVWIFFSVLPKLEWLWLWIDLKDLDQCFWLAS